LVKKHIIPWGDIMIYIYYDFGGTHSSSIAAAIHLKLIPADRVPGKADVINVPMFDKLSFQDRAKIVYRGTDNEGNKVFTLGYGIHKKMVFCLQNAIYMLHQQYGFNERMVLSSTAPTVPLSMTFGGFFSKVLKLVFIGRPLLIKGARKNFKKMAKLVEITINSAKSNNLPELNLTNKNL
jgi:hypothetical protein